jgi:type IV secretory pathway VirB10-like protein
MATKAGIFFAGVATTIVILAAGFGGGLLMANSALKEPTNYQARSTPAGIPSPMRVILPSMAEAAQPLLPPAQQVAAVPEPASPPPPQVSPVKDVQAPAEKHIQKADIRKAEGEEKGSRKRYAERKAKRLATERDRRQQQQMVLGERRDAPVMAFGGDEPSARPFPSFSGND